MTACGIYTVGYIIAYTPLRFTAQDSRRCIVLLLQSIITRVKEVMFHPPFVCSFVCLLAG